VRVVSVWSRIFGPVDESAQNFFDLVSGRSEIDKLNNRGAKTEPCGRPLFNFLSLLILLPR